MSAAPKSEPPIDPAVMDATIRTNCTSRGARAMVAAVKTAQRNVHVQTLSTQVVLDNPELQTFQRMFPRLFAMVNDPTHSPAILYALLDQLESVEKGASTTHNASVATGTILVNSFVRPKLGLGPISLPQ